MGDGLRTFIRLRPLAASASAAELPAEAPWARAARIVERLGAEGEFPGAIVVMRDGRDVLAKGVGFADGSTAIMRLEEREALLALPHAPAERLFRVGEGSCYAPGVDGFVCLDGNRLLPVCLLEDRVGFRG